MSAERNLLQLEFNKLYPAVANIPQGASHICILPEEISSLQVYLAIALIWRTFCQDASAYDDADARRLLCDCGNGLAGIEHQSLATNAIIDLHFVVFDVSTRGRGKSPGLWVRQLDQNGLKRVRIYIGDDVGQGLFRVRIKTHEPPWAAGPFRRRLSEDLGSHIRTLNDDRCGIHRMLMVSRCVARRYHDVQQRHIFICEYGHMK